MNHNFLKKGKTNLILFTFLFLFSFFLVSGVDVSSDPNLNNIKGVNIQQPEIPTNYSLLPTVNNSKFTDCWSTAEGIKCDVVDILTSEITDDLTYLAIDGSNANQNVDIGVHNFITSGAAFIDDIGIGLTDGTIETIAGNMTIKVPTGQGKHILVERIKFAGDTISTDIVGEDIVIAPLDDLFLYPQSNDVWINDTARIMHDLIIDHTAVTDTDQIFSTSIIGGNKFMSTRASAVPVYALGSSDGTTSNRDWLDDGDELGRLDFYAWNDLTQNWQLVSNVRSYADGGHSPGNMQTGLRWYASSATSALLRMQLDKTGDLSLLTGSSHLIDNEKTYWGTGDDASCYYDGSDLICNPKEVGDGKFIIEGNLSVNGNITSKNVFIPQYIFSHTNRTISLASAGVWVNITFDQEDSDIKQGISHTYNDATNHTFMFMDAGIYDVSYDLDVEDTSASSTDIDVAVRMINSTGGEVYGSVFESDITKKGTEVELSHEFLVSSLVNQVYYFQFTATDPDVEISTHGTFGIRPESASIVIKKIANLQ